jgi:cytochrome c oxidase subunit 2
MKPFRIALVTGLSICIAILCLAANSLVRGTMRFSRQPILEIRAVAHEWWWEFDYPSLGIKTSDVLYVPSATNVRLDLVSADVIHSFWIAGMKDSLDIVPGKTHPLDLVVKSPGELYGNCDSGCGCGTVCMRFRVLASIPGDFGQWAARERLSRSGFKPPKKNDAPACALDTGHDGHAGHNIPASHLQRLLDGGEATSNHPYH